MIAQKGPIEIECVKCELEYGDTYCSTCPDKSGVGVSLFEGIEVRDKRTGKILAKIPAPFKPRLIGGYVDIRTQTSEDEVDGYPTNIKAKFEDFVLSDYSNYLSFPVMVDSLRNCGACILGSEVKSYDDTALRDSINAHRLEINTLNSKPDDNFANASSVGAADVTHDLGGNDFTINNTTNGTIHGSGVLTLDYPKVDITGFLDPTGVQLSPQASNPGVPYSVDSETIWINQVTGTLWRGNIDLEVQTPTDLSIGTIGAAVFELESSTGANANLPMANATTAGIMSGTDKSKLDGIDVGAEVNVQPDWNETNNASDSYILNKPTIPLDDDVEGVTGTSVDNTDPRNPVIDRETASETSYDNTVSGLTATDVQDAIDELDDGAVKVFLELTDTPNDYTGLANQLVRVKADETGLETVQLIPDAVPTDASLNVVTSDGVYDALQSKVDTGDVINGIYFDGDLKLGGDLVEDTEISANTFNYWVEKNGTKIGHGTEQAFTTFFGGSLPFSGIIEENPSTNGFTRNAIGISTLGTQKAVTIGDVLFSPPLGGAVGNGFVINTSTGSQNWVASGTTSGTGTDRTRLTLNNTAFLATINAKDRIILNSNGTFFNSNDVGLSIGTIQMLDFEGRINLKSDNTTDTDESLGIEISHVDGIKVITQEVVDGNVTSGKILKATGTDGSLEYDDMFSSSDVQNGIVYNSVDKKLEIGGNMFKNTELTIDNPMSFGITRNDLRFSMSNDAQVVTPSSQIFSGVYDKDNSTNNPNRMGVGLSKIGTNTVATVGSVQTNGVTQVTGTGLVVTGGATSSSTLTGSGLAANQSDLSYARVNPEKFVYYNGGQNTIESESSYTSIKSFDETTSTTLTINAELRLDQQNQSAKLISNQNATGGIENTKFVETKLSGIILNSQQVNEGNVTAGQVWTSQGVDGLGEWQNPSTTFQEEGIDLALGQTTINLTNPSSTTADEFNTTVLYNGVDLEYGINWTISSGTITLLFNTAQVGDRLRVRYF